MSRIAVVAGGTGGHIYPALSLCKALALEGHQLYFVGNKGKMEEKVLLDYPQYTFLPLDNEGLKPGLMTKVKSVLSQLKSIRRATRYLKDYQIDLVVSFGGYVSFPLVFAAQQLKIPTLLHEANSLAGKANKWVSKKADGVAICYERTKDDFKQSSDVRYIGNPRASDVYYQLPNKAVLEDLGLDASKPIVYMVMGSLGSSSVGEVIVDLLNTYLFKDVQFVISTGANNFDFYNEKLSSKNVVVVRKFVSQVDLLRFCDVVVSRAGASSIAEILASSTPSILIPSPYVANNHQYYNALSCQNKQAAIMIEEKDLTVESLYENLQLVLKDETLRELMKTQALSLAKVNAVNDLVSWVKELLHESSLA